MVDDPIPPLSDEARAECVLVQILTRSMLRQSSYHSSGEPYELAFLRRDNQWFTLPVQSLQRVRAILAELALPPESVTVICGLDEDSEILHAQATGRAPVYLH